MKDNILKNADTAKRFAAANKSNTAVKVYFAVKNYDGPFGHDGLPSRFYKDTLISVPLKPVFYPVEADFVAEYNPKSGTDVVATLRRVVDGVTSTADCYKFYRTI